MAMARVTHTFQRKSTCRFLIVAAMIAAWPNSTFAEAIDLMRFSRIGDEGSLELEFNCAMQESGIQHDAPMTSWSVELALGLDCRLPLRNVRSEAHRPPGGRLMSLSRIEFDKTDRNRGSLHLTFEEPVNIRVEQTANTYMLTVHVTDAAPQQANQEESAPAAAPVAPTPAITAAPNERVSRRVEVAEPVTRNRFVIRVAVLDGGESPDGAVLQPYEALTLYTNSITVGDREWKELKLGFFDNEDAANQVLLAIQKRYPNALITVAYPEEQTASANTRYRFVADEPIPQIAAHDVRATATLTESEISSAMAAARDALVRQDYAGSIAAYRQLVAEPGSHRADATEFLGVALEKSGLADDAAAEYRAYLAEFPEGAGADRVRQRLAVLDVAPTEPVTVANEQPAVSRDQQTPMWDYFGELSQYYLRGVSLGVGNNDDNVSQSALLSQGMFYIRRLGERFDIIARANLGYLYEFSDDDSADQALVSMAYIDINDSTLDLSARVGRQRQLSDGVMGRFDGVHMSYQWRPDISMAVMAGFPVDSPRYQSSSDHYLYGASVSFEKLLERFDVTLFTNQQRVDGIADRQAFGFETQFQTRSVNLVALLDYDASFNILNTLSVAGSWRAHDRFTIHGRARDGAARFLSTRNAIIGQPVNTVRELFGTWSEGQIRRLARNRTAEEQAASGGFSFAMTDRLQLKVDASYLEYSPTVASGGVASIPGSGPRYTWGGHVQGSGFLKPGSIFMVGYGHEETQSIDTDSVWFDMRYPISDAFRIQTRLATAIRVANQGTVGDIEQLVLSPMVRLMYAARHWRFEFEAGGRWSNREFPAGLEPPLITDGEIEQSDYYLQIGYTVDFN